MACLADKGSSLYGQLSIRTIASEFVCFLVILIGGCSIAWTCSLPTLCALCVLVMAQRYVEGGVAEEEELYVDVKPVVMVGCDKVTKAQR